MPAKAKSKPQPKSPPAPPPPVPSVKPAPRHLPIPFGVNALLNRQQVMDALGGMSSSKFKQIRAGGIVPPPDAFCGKSPRWTQDAVNSAIEKMLLPTRKRA